ncbi:transmembrane protein 14C-like [Panonychus citri]|uniref:transmembrane protein 14C-like n=1 Tax=Panonychus citri TaxID=50023 RepID=UPI002306EAA5|nr:transmembrane protein 14C-like [Panonychus citri]
MSPRSSHSYEKPEDTIELDNNSDFVILDTPSVDQFVDNLLYRRTQEALTRNNPNTNLPASLVPESSTSPPSLSPEMGIDMISSAYAALVAAGGVIGYVKAGSIPSLAAGLIFGSTLGVGAYMTSKDPQNYYLTLGTSTLLTGLMGYRFFNTGKFMPAGLIAALSVAMVVNISIRAITGPTQHVKK